MKKAILVGDLNADCAILRSQDQFPVGHSSQISAILTGPVEEKEQVIVDFSKAKKALKVLIDSVGPDHKLIIADKLVPGTEAMDEQVYATELPFKGELPESGVIRVVMEGNPTLAQVLQKSLVDAVFKLKYLGMVDRQELMAEHEGLEEALEVLSTVEIEWRVSEDQQLLSAFDLGAATRSFRYIHGLPNSSSFGCQMPIHGHLSVLQVRPHFMVKEDMLLEWVPDLIHFIDGSCTSNPGADGHVQVAYNTLQRGDFSLTFSPEGDVLRVAAPTDTTIENIAEWFVIQMRHRFNELGFTGKTFDLYVSEGLKKGCLLTSLVV